MRNVTECQQKLIALGYLAALDDKGNTNADGKFGERSLDAYNHYIATLGRPPVNNVTMVDLNATLFPEEQPPAPAQKVGLSPVLTTIINIALSTMKGKVMLTTMDKAWVAGVVSFVCNYIVNHFFHVTIDDGTQGLIVNLIATFVLPLVAVWLVPNKPKAT